MKKAAIILAVAAVLAAAGGIVAWNSLDLIVRAALLHWGPDVTGVKIDVDRVDISPFDGRGRIGGLVLGNAPTFSAPTSARFGDLRLVVDPSTLRSDVVVLRELAVESLDVTYERGNRGSNLDAIQRSIEAYVRGSGARSAKAADEGAKGKRRFVIERLALRKVRVLMTTRGLKGQGLTFDLPDVELRDVGKDRGGVTASEAAAIVASTLQQKIAVRVLTNIDALRRGGLEGAIDALRGLVK